MASEADRRAAWDAEMEKKGITATAAALNHAGRGSGSEVMIMPVGKPQPHRAYVEEWLGRKEADKGQREDRRYRTTRRLAMTALAVSVGSLLLALYAVRRK